ncbi:MAG: protein kinase [Lentisphaeria bacterium]|nr:protein kinase [Lentisphaeria bacterium]
MIANLLIFAALLVVFGLAVFGAFHAFTRLRHRRDGGTASAPSSSSPPSPGGGMPPTVPGAPGALEAPTVVMSAGDAPRRNAMPEQIDQYRVVSRLGQGNMGCVYKAETPDGETIAIKVMLRDLLKSRRLTQRFSKEAQVMAILQHPNIVRLIQSGAFEDMDYFAMEFVDGPSVDDLLQAGKLNVHRTIAIVKQVCQALGYAHALGIVHRDIKPGNIMIAPEDVAKVVDFGIAHLDMGEDNNLTLANDVMGTPSFMSPEQHYDCMNVDHRSDIYSLGATLYQMLSGNLPGGVLRMDLIPDGLREIVTRAMMPKPEERYANILEMYEELVQFEKGGNASRAQAELDNISENDRLRQVMVESLFPKKVPDAARAEVASLYLPAAGVGGNYYDFIELPGGRLGMLVGNVAEKPNARSAIFLAVVRTAFRLAAQRETDPGKALAACNAYVSKEDFDVFAVISYVIWDGARRELAVSSAGYRPAIVLHQDGRFENIECMGLGLGLDPDGEFATRRLQLAPGDVVLLSSAGMTGMLNISGEPFSEERLRLVLQVNSERGAKDILDALRSALARFAAGMAQSDDATALVLKVTA